MTLPNDWPGPNGRTLKVHRAKVKRSDKHAGHIAGWIVRCGNGHCADVIGYPDSYLMIVSLPASFVDIMSERVRITIDQPTADIWCLTHLNRYYGTKPTGYHIRPERKASRSSRTPLHASNAHLIPTYHDQDPSDVIGQIPVPPCIVFCPTCGMPNHVEPPDATPPFPTPA